MHQCTCTRTHHVEWDTSCSALGGKAEQFFPGAGGKVGRIGCQFNSVQSLSPVRLFVNPWTAAHQASLSTTNSWSLLKLLSIKLLIPSNHLILCHPLLLLPSIFPSIRVFSNESVLPIRCPKYWRFSFSISPFNKYSGLISFRMDWLDRVSFGFKIRSLFTDLQGNSICIHGSPALLWKCSL